MKLITFDNYKIKVADEALLVKPLRRLYNMDRSKGKERFLEQMSVLFFVYDPRSNYSYIVDERDRLSEVLRQEGIREFHNTAEFKEAVAVYRRLCTTPSSVLLSDTNMVVDKVRKVLKSIDFEELDEEKKVAAVKTVASVVAMIPKLVRDLSEAEKAVQREVEETGSARGSQELSIMDNPGWGL